MLDRKEDRELVSRARRGELLAFDVLVDRHKVGLAKHLLRVGVPRSDLDDLVQETFIEAFRSLARFQAPHHFMGWLRRIGYRVYLHWAESRRSEREGIQRVAEIKDRERADRDSTDARQKANELLYELIGQLSPPNRQLLEDRYLSGLSPGAIAKKTGLSERSVRRKVEQAMRLLRRRHAERVRSQSVVENGRT